MLLIDMAGTFSTLRKSCDDPYGEKALPWFFFFLRDATVLFALESYSLTTVLLPAGGLFIIASIIFAVLLSRSLVKKVRH